MKHKPLGFIIVLLLGLQLAMTLPVNACSGNFRRPDLKEYVDGADLILVGTVTASSNTDPYEASYTVQVENYLKGEGPDSVLITGFGTGSGDCMNAVAIDEHWLFLVDGNPRSDDVLHASYLQVYDAVHDANVANMDAVKTIVGHEPVLPYSTPLGTLMRYWMTTPAFKVIVLVSSLLIVMVVSLAIKRRHLTRFSKRKNG